MFKTSSLGGRFATLALLAVVVAPAVSSAAIFNYTDQISPKIKYINISENTHSDPLPLFGAPTLAGDTLDFSPNNFFASSQLAVPPFDMTDGLLKFRGMSQPGFGIENIKFAEGGALSVVGGAATDATMVDVSAVGFVDILEVDGVSVNKISIPINLTFSFGSNGGNDNGTWRRVSEGFANGVPWTGSQFIDLNQELTNRGISYTRGATLIDVVLDNSLYAQSEAVGGAYIDKKDFFTVTTNIPEPTSCLLAIVGLMGVALASRRGR